MVVALEISGSKGKVCALATLVRFFTFPPKFAMSVAWPPAPPLGWWIKKRWLVGQKRRALRTAKNTLTAVLPIMGVGVVLNALCIAIALSGVDLHQFLAALFLLGIGWNFLFTGSTTLSLQTYTPEEKDRAQGALNFFVFATLAVSSLASGVLVTTQGWTLLNLGSIIPVVLVALALGWLAMHQRRAVAGGAV